jgi:hypothetical protein
MKNSPQAADHLDPVVAAGTTMRVAHGENEERWNNQNR